MNVFEDLVDELKEANLLENTILDLSQEPAPKPVHDASAVLAIEPEVPVLRVLDEGGVTNGNGKPLAEPVVKFPGSNEPSKTSSRQTARAGEFHRKRAMEDVASLQMVDHVFSGIEREYMKMLPAAYDDLAARKALHKFLQVASESGTREFAAAEFAMINEIERWTGALLTRDQNINVANLRRFCENSRPALSSQALMALARFYRNSPYSESVRSKFDCVLTRLFSRDGGDEKRALLFTRSEMLVHIKALYATWSSVSVYSEDEITADIERLLKEFEIKAKEAEAADDFDRLVNDGFFDKLRTLKETCGEFFYVPEIAASAIDCNIRIGNRFVDLIREARLREHPKTIEEKYGYTYQQIISEAAGKTLNLVELLKSATDGKITHGDLHQAVVSERPARPTIPLLPAKEKRSPAVGTGLLRVNKWLLGTTVVIVILSLGLYFWAGRTSGGSDSGMIAKIVDMGGTELAPHIKIGRKSETTFYAVMSTGWEGLSDDEKKDILRKTAEFGKGLGVDRVELLNSNGRAVAFASGARIELLPQ